MVDVTPLNVLVIEDDEDTRSNLCDILELDDHRVQAVGTARDALAHGGLADVEVILLDRRLPDAVAEDLLPRLQSAAPVADVIIVTGHADLDGAIAALRHRATDYLLKPINPEALRASLQRQAERRHLAERLVQAERLAALGEAMAGLTHESRNALARSQSNLERLARRLKGDDELLQLIDGALRANDDIQRQFEEVRDYAAHIHLRKEPIDLTAVIQAAWEELANERKGRQAMLRVRQTDLDLNCEVDPYVLRHAFRNILDNALAACDDPVEIDVEFSVAGTAGAPALQIAIRDNGPGLPPEVNDRAFDAFFTTKTRGTGLGLAIVKRSIEAHGGQVVFRPQRTINSDSQNGSARSGAEIIITLPRC